MQLHPTSHPKITHCHSEHSEESLADAKSDLANARNLKEGLQSRGTISIPSMLSNLITMQAVSIGGKLKIAA
ncbi:MAG: hypothetical protein ACD_38C00139G0002 [uncultured bacterium]|uniref:Uncharacterized protein n=1 Tax=Candidatus Daviesbacteria bacterium GW2011_GWC2_40_12 TaxID=1618431 RepID=A0A0G0TUP0_9BACT|nr:MAG: hypothetical protein ACD_38C00139G0002 [uncultured bacterium]KKQ84895.1 MAG: hypothetical protein UT04_C0010G0007 [Candidatus Daviesbacteria bacterium GW2011_GWF2_38_7]KKR16271.1 MAG: hypothetical protein UT45_C0007G0028 [Candidatus Daviesbacteria bacterium GW2011_GWA2_39_33]KKR23279.1 MAG: hypothetical protein UT54_C0055G0005 [Candidatus Daviesbacteria bacterium GW2011_GWB1_39_5]KKR41597.1 MAG: hypothetical protein UT77_C0009G0055 [Candidatus Daviesbacteria bacterium GW2011_GWC2_40_12]